MTKTEYLYSRLGEHINLLIRTLALKNDWRMGKTVAEVAKRTDYAEATVRSWRQGRICPPDETIETLARIGEELAGLNRIWGERLLRSARYPDAAIPILVNEIWGYVELRDVPHNLPRPEHSIFIGRQEEMNRLLKLLSPDYGANIISVDGIGGVGKTALVLETAYRCLGASTGKLPDPDVPVFDAIIFTSAKQQRLTPHGIFTLYESQRTLRDIYAEIARTLNRPSISNTMSDEQQERVRDALSRQSTLLILDNLETLEEKQDIITFLYNLPPTVKAVITTRERALFAPIRMEKLPEVEGSQLIRHEAREKKVSLDDAKIRRLYQRTGGVPGAIIYAIGQMSGGYQPDTVLDRLSGAKGDVARFCFESSVSSLYGQPAHKLLMAMSMFPKRPLREAIIRVAGFSSKPLAAREGLDRLLQISLINQLGERCNMLPLTREYALAELAVNQDFEQDSRERWIEWYREYVQEYGMAGRDWGEWHIEYDYLDEEWQNILAVFDWCASQERYEDIVFLRENLDSYCVIYGRWNDSLQWFDWLIQAAERRAKLKRVVREMASKGSRLTMMGRVAEAQATLEKALRLREQVTPKEELALFRNLARLSIRQRNLQEAQKMLKQARTALQNTDPKNPDYKRDEIGLIYWQAVIYFEDRDYDKSKMLFKNVVEQGKLINWKRAVIYAQNWLADIAIAQGDLEEAARLLQGGLPVSERNQDRRRTAFYKRSFAYLEQKHGNLEKAQHWAKSALDGFDRLGMNMEADEMQSLIVELESKSRV
jgi:tetratricopeptide (TPR) repeat protein